MNAPVSHPVPPYRHTPLFPLGEDRTPYRKLSLAGESGNAAGASGGDGGR